MKRIEVKTFFEFEECECGGIFSKQIDTSIFYTNFSCNSCIKVKKFDKPYPKVTYEWFEGVAK